MRLLIGGAERGPAVASAVIVASLAILTLTVISGLPAAPVSVLVIGVVGAVLLYRKALQWHALLSVLALVILLIPIRRYTIPVNMPFSLEPYRILVAVFIALWVLALLADPRVRLRASGLGGPLFVIVLATLASDIFNGDRIRQLSVRSDVLKSLTFFATFLLVLFFIVSVVRSRERVDSILRVLVVGGAIVGVASMIEARTGNNLFNHLSNPLFKLDSRILTTEQVARGGRLRAYASAQHPIALAAVLVLLIPPAIYLAVARNRIWWLPASLILLGALSTQSRTGITMLAAIVLVFFAIRPKQLRRFWPALVPAILALHVILPGTLGTIKSSFFPKGGLVSEQQNAPVGSGRLASSGPALDQVRKVPLVGVGFGTRVFALNRQNSFILDDQWLGTLLETGTLGVAGWVWLFLRFIRRMGRAAKGDKSREGWLPMAFAASIAAFALGMFTYDAFSFIQVTFVMYMMLGLGVAAVRLSPEPARALAPNRLPQTTALPSRAS
jgi:O-antigen ligase